MTKTEKDEEDSSSEPESEDEVEKKDPKTDEAKDVPKVKQESKDEEGSSDEIEKIKSEKEDVKVKTEGGENAKTMAKNEKNDESSSEEDSSGSSSSSDSDSSCNSSDSGNDLDSEEQEEGRKTEQTAVEQAAQEAGTLAEFDGVGMCNYWRFCHGMHQDQTTTEALTTVETRQHDKGLKRIDLWANLCQKIWQTKCDKKRKNNSDDDIEKALEKDENKVTEPSLPMRRLRTKTSIFLVALCHQKWCRQC